MAQHSSVFLAVILLLAPGCGQVSDSNSTQPTGSITRSETPKTGDKETHHPARPPLDADELAKDQSSPSAVARASFAALKRGDITTYVSFFHPAELKRFKSFAVEVFKKNKSEKESKQIRKLFAPYGTLKKVAAANGSDLISAFLNNSLLSIPDFEKIMRDAKLQILGKVIEAPGKVHVITRTILPRPKPVSCQKHYRRWYILLNDEIMRLFSNLKRIEHFRKKNAAIENIRQKITMDKINVLGYVKDGKGRAQVLCRIKMKIEDFSFPVLGCYPVRDAESAWKHLDDKDKTKLVAALRSKWVK